jgi:hypothetical protein
MTANPAAICCLPYDANCRPGDRDDLVNLAKQVAALTDPHKAAVHSAAVHSADVDNADADTGHDRGKAGEHGNHGNHGEHGEHGNHGNHGNHGQGHSESARAR